MTSTEDECARLVKNTEPRASGATWGVQQGDCYAELGNQISSSQGYRACLFEGTFLNQLLKYHISKYIYQIVLNDFLNDSFNGL